MNTQRVWFAFFIVLALTLNFGFFIGEIDNPLHHNSYELFLTLVVSLIATVLKVGDRSHMGAVLLATRLGLALATQYLENDQPVVITYRKYRPEIETLKSKGAKILYADFSSDEGIYSAAESLSAEHSRLKSIVHNASTWRTDPGHEMGLHNLALMMRIHVGVSMILTDALAGALLASSNASVVNISDYVAGRGSANHMA
ncbi:SDR family oxidoreductase, partial [Litorivicinus sp.]|nr:SDR family oxidoreductase [Litorivicinus sp.]